MDINQMPDNKVMKYRPPVAGTDCDRRRKLTSFDIKYIQKNFVNEKGAISDLAKKMGIRPNEVRYHGDPEYKSACNLKRKEYGYKKYNYQEKQKEYAEQTRILVNENKLNFRDYSKNFKAVK